MRHATSIMILTGLLASAPAGSDHDSSREHAMVETREIRAARTLQMHANDHGFAKDACPFVSYIATAPPQGKVVLTFDDGPSPDVTQWVMNVLAQRHVKATFFLVGSRVEKYPDLVARIRREGHLVGNHSWEHPNFHAIDFVRQIGTISQSDGVLTSSMHPLRLFRYPYGNASCAANDFLKQLDYQIVGWHSDSCDWAYDRTGQVGDTDAKICDVADKDRADFVSHAVHAIQARHGGILLMHEIHRNTIKHLPEIVDALLQAGYRFTNLDDPDLRTAFR